MRINYDGLVIEFNGSHTANVTDAFGNMDVFTFAFKKDRASYLDFLSAAIAYLEDDALGECMDCKQGKHGMAHPNHPNLCACCFEVLNNA